MNTRKELLDRWSLLLAALSAGLAWAVQVPLLAALAIGLAVLLVRAIVAGANRKDLGRPAAGLPEVEPGSKEAEWLDRAEKAAESFESISDSLSAGPLAERVGEMKSSVHETVETLHRLAGRATTTGKALSRINKRALLEEKLSLRKALKTASPDVHADIEKSIEAVQAQEDVRTRLVTARGKMIARLQSGTLGLESLVARVAELSTTAGIEPLRGTESIDVLSEELESIRYGVTKTEEATRGYIG
jgi:hypothetical protein